MPDNNQNKARTLNLGMIIFFVLSVYVVICVFLYFTQKHIVPYEVMEGSLSENNIYTAMCLRDETVVYSENAGYINYYAREGSKVAANDLVYTLDETGHLSDYMAANESGENSLSDSDMTELKTEIIGFVNSFSPQNFSDVYDFSYSVKGTVVKLANYNLLQNVNALADSPDSMVQYCSSPMSGIIVYSVDNYETLTLDQMTRELMDQKNYEKNQLIGNELVAYSDPVYKLSTNEDWSVVIQVDREKADELLNMEYVKVRFLKNQNTSWGEVSAYTNPLGDTFVQLKFTNSMLTFCTDRFIDIELLLDEEKGLKIPISSIVEKEFYIVPQEYITKGGNSGNEGVLRKSITEEGVQTTEFIETSIHGVEGTNLYLDTTTLRAGDYLVKEGTGEEYMVGTIGTRIGVYCINKGYADFKEITILSQNNEYAIVAPNTMYGLNVFDYIVLDSATVSEDELIYE